MQLNSILSTLYISPQAIMAKANNINLIWDNEETGLGEIRYQICI
jgi:hypothetical protein